MKKPAKPETLYQAALRQEQERHDHRTKQLLQFKNRLDALTPYLEALKAAGVQIWPAEMLFARKAITLFPGFFNSVKTQKAMAVMTEHGFKEISRKDYGSYDSVVLAKGHVHLDFHVDKPRAASAEPAQG
jgi:hypothetical protein